jgi:hypothetical protein
MSYLVCGRTVDGAYLVHGRKVSEEQFMAWREEVREEFQDAPLRCAPGTLASEHAQADFACSSP